MVNLVKPGAIPASIASGLATPGKDAVRATATSPGQSGALKMLVGAPANMLVFAPNRSNNNFGILRFADTPKHIELSCGQ